MKIYNKFISLGVATVAALGFASCNDFLDEPSRTGLTEEQIYGNLETASKSLDGLYTQWRNLWQDHNFYYLSDGTDEIQNGAYQALKENGGKNGAIDRFDALLSSEQEYVTNTWNWRWPKISEAAKLINALEPQIGENQQAKTMWAEASCIRGQIMMDMTMIYGRIPIIDISRMEELGTRRQDLTTVWTYIINDLTVAANNAPETNNPGRVTRYVGLMLLGYAYMSAPVETGLRDFSKAEECLRQVVNGPFSLVPYYDLFDYSTPNTSEAILEFQFNNPQPDNNMIEFEVGSRLAYSMGQDGCYFSGFDHAVPTPWAYSDIEDGGIWEDGDVRKEESIRYEFTWNGKNALDYLDGLSWEDLSEDDQDEHKPHIKKYEDFRTDVQSGFGYNNMWYSGKNIPWLRLGNAYLLYAECLNELNRGDEAVEWVNDVRSRAWEFNLPADKAWQPMGKEAFRDAIMTERVRELFGERWRRFDLVRTGKFYEYVKERNKWAKRSGTIQPWHSVWPIPMTEIEQNDEISRADQNEGYI